MNLRLRKRLTLVMEREENSQSVARKRHQFE